MTLLEKINNCKSNDEIDEIIKEAILDADNSSCKVEQLGFLENNKSNNLFKGFIPLSTKIKYESIAMETYSMETTDYFYDFAHFIKKCDINNKGLLIHSLEYFINNYFGYPGKARRGEIFNDVAWQTTTTDEEYFAALENNKIGDLKGKGAAECTERSALAQQILSLYGIESYYCMGCVDLEKRQEAHSFNIVKRKNDYALLDYSIPITSYNLDGSVRGYYPFVGEISNEEFEEFIRNGTIKTFDNYKYLEGNQKVVLDDKRSYVVGAYSIDKNISNSNENSK